MAVLGQNRLQRFQQQQDICLRTGLSHQANPPHLARKLAQPGADLDIIVVQQGAAYRRLVNAVGDADAVEHPQAVALLGDEFDAQGFEPGRQSLVVALVAGVAGGQPFFFDQAQGFTQGIGHRDRGGMVIDPLGLAFVPVIAQQADIEIPALDPRAAPTNDIQRGLTEGNRGQPRRTAQALLGAAIAGVNAPVVDLKRTAAQRGDGVHHKQGAGLVNGDGHVFERLPGAG